MIKKIICTTALVLLSTTSFYAQKQNTLLWEISGKGIEKPSYLFGTIHITCDATLKPKVIDALNKTERLFLEFDMTDPEMATKMMGKLQMTDGKKISQLVTKEQAEKIDKFLKENFGMPLSYVDTYKPFFFQSLFYTKMINCPVQSFENELMKITKEQNEKVYGLETMESQLAIFDKIPYEKQIEDLNKMLESIEKKDFSEMEKLITLYQDENLNDLMKIISESDLQTVNQFNEDLLVNRNKNWVPIIIEKSKEQATFFGVGAAHLAGENGVITLLKKQGYKVKPVK